jgi:ribosomal protein S18 acetylase RimI-like enzyme
MTITAKTNDSKGPRPATAVDGLTEFTGTDLHDLCDAAEAAITAGGGFGWLTVPPRQAMEGYWKGVLLVPERELFVARLDRTICGSAQLQRAPRNNEAQALSGNLTTSFMAPWARGHGLARMLILAVEAAARDAGLRVLNLDVRESQAAAIKLYESLGYQLWGRHPHYARVGEHWVTGQYYYKDLRVDAAMAAARQRD